MLHSAQHISCLFYCSAQHKPHLVCIKTVIFLIQLHVRQSALPPRQFTSQCLVSIIASFYTSWKQQGRKLRINTPGRINAIGFREQATEKRATDLHDSFTINDTPSASVLAWRPFHVIPQSLSDTGGQILLTTKLYCCKCSALANTDQIVSQTPRRRSHLKPCFKYRHYSLPSYASAKGSLAKADILIPDNGHQLGPGKRMIKIYIRIFLKHLGAHA